MLISIVIPVYNGEKYIKRCLDSVVCQKYSYLEIIVINDGSTDNTLKIIETYSKNDNRIKLINIKNGGVSNARNIGILNSTGSYITFIDADDYIEEDYIKKCVAFLLHNNCVYLKTNYKRLIDGVFSIKGLNNNKIFKDFKDIEEIIFEKKLLCECWGSLINREFLMKHNIRFRTDLIYGEDTLFNYEVLIKSNELLYIDNPGYIYFCNDLGITKNINPTILKQKITNLINIYNIMNDFSYLKSNFIFEKIEYNLNLLILNSSYSEFYCYYKKLYNHLVIIKIFDNLDINKFDNKIKCRINILIKFPSLYFLIFKIYKIIKRK